MPTTRLIVPILLAAAASAMGCASTVDMPETAEGTVSESNSQTAGADHHIERRLSHMQERLDLSDDQVALLRPVLEGQRARNHEARESFRAELEGILTPEQLARVEDMRGRRGRHHGPRGMRGMRGHDGPPDPARMLSRMTEELELTEAQVEALTPIFEAVHARHAELRELPREERREAFRAIREETKTAVDGILTEEQRVKLEERFSRRGGPRGRMGMGHMGRRHHGGGFEAGGAPADVAPAE
jgi:Spy/CpxP family protein refolding chaperone